MNEILIHVGKRATKMRLIKWEGGAALTAVDDAGRPAGKQSVRVFSWDRTGKVRRYRQVDDQAQAKCLVGGVK